MDKVGTQEAGERRETHWVGSQAEQSALMLCQWCLALASDCEVLLGTTAMIKEPVALVAVVVIVWPVVRMTPFNVLLLCYFFL